MDADKAMQARIMLGGESQGDEICACCGIRRARNQLKKVVKNSFTQMDDLIKAPSTYICDSCSVIYNCSDMRFKIIFSDGNGYKIIDRADVIPIIRNPPEKFVLSVPYSFKKHHWLFAGVSNGEKAYIGTDDRTVEVDYIKHDINDVIDSIQELINWGVPRGEIINGNYSVFTINKFGTIIHRNEAKIKDLRFGGFVELIVKYTPAKKEKLVYESEVENPMLNKDEMNAVNFLGSIASNSSYRVQNGIQFWKGYFERRINRFKKLKAIDFASKLSEAVGADSGAYVGMCKDMSDEELEKMMNEIRNKTHILVSIVYGERQKG